MVGRTTVFIPRGTGAREGIKRAFKAESFTPAPSRRPAGNLPRRPSGGQTTDDVLADKFQGIFDRDERTDLPGVGVQLQPQDFVPEPEDVQEARRGLAAGETVVVTKQGQVQVRDAKGRIVRATGGGRDDAGRFVSAKQIVAGKAKSGGKGRVEENTLRRLIALQLSMFQSTGGISPARLAAGWRGAKESGATREGDALRTGLSERQASRLRPKGELVMDDDNHVRIVSGGRTIAKAKITDIRKGSKAESKEAD